MQKWHFRHYRFEPNSTQYTRHEDYPIRHLIRVNEHGFIGDEIPIKKGPNTFRIAVIGDSFVSNVSVKESLNLTTTIKKFLQEQGQGKKIEVINGGVNGYGPGQEFSFYQESIKKFKSDVVVLVHYQNDLENLERNRIFYKSNDKLINSKKIIQQNTWLADVINGISISKFLANKIHHNKINKNNCDEVNLRKNWETYSLLMKHFKESVEQDGGKFISVLAPRLNYFINPTVYKENLDEYEDDVINMHKNLSIPTLHLSQLWSQSDSLFNRQLYLAYDDHWSEYGCHVVACHILNFIKDTFHFSWETIEPLENPYEIFYPKVPYISEDVEATHIKVKYALLDLIDPSLLTYVLNSNFKIKDCFDLRKLKLNKKDDGVIVKFSPIKNYTDPKNFTPLDLFPERDIEIKKIDKYTPEEFHRIFLVPASHFLPEGFRINFKGKEYFLEIFIQKEHGETQLINGVMHIKHRNAPKVELDKLSFYEVFLKKLKDQFNRRFTLKETHFKTVGISIKRNNISLDYYLKTNNNIVLDYSISEIQHFCNDLVDYLKNLIENDMELKKLVDHKKYSIDATVNILNTTPWTERKQDKVVYIKLRNNKRYSYCTFNEWHLYPYLLENE